MQVHDVPLLINGDYQTVTYTVGSGVGVFYGPQPGTGDGLRASNSTTFVAAGGSFTVTRPVYVVAETKTATADLRVGEAAAGASPGSTTGGGGAIAVPFVASGPRNIGDIVAQAGALYTATSTGTNPASWDGTGYSLGAAKGAAITELNGVGVATGDWLGNGVGTAATYLGDRLTAGVLNPRDVYSAGATYSPGDTALEAGILYLNISASTGVAPSVNVNTTTGLGTKWYRMSPPGPKGDTGATGSATADLAVALRHIEIATRQNAFAGTIDAAAKGQSFSRADAASTVTMNNRQILGGGAIVLAGGEAISNLKLHSGSAALVAGVHQFVAFYDFRTGALLASGTDVTNQAFAANSVADFPISYTPATTKVVRPVYYCEATTLPSLAGKGSQTPAIVEPRLGGIYDVLTAGSGPGALPATLAAAAGAKGPFWCEWK